MSLKAMPMSTSTGATKKMASSSGRRPKEKEPVDPPSDDLAASHTSWPHHSICGLSAGARATVRRPRGRAVF